MTWADGAYYDGNFIEGKFHGKGTYRYADGTSFVGEFKHNKRHGTLSSSNF